MLLLAFPTLAQPSTPNPQPSSAKVINQQGETFVASDRIEKPLTQEPGDAKRGATLFTTREGGHCVLCHAAPGAHAAGNLGPALDGVGGRLNAAQLRARIVDFTRINPDAVMPAFHRVENLKRVAPEFRGKPILAAQQVEDLVAYLASLK